MRRVLVLLNARAGGLLGGGHEALREAFAAAFKDAAEVSVHLLRPRTMQTAIAHSAQSAHDTIIIGGGDGTVGTAAQALADSGKVLGVVPLGTLNLLARDLGMPDDPRAAIDALAHAGPRQIDLATINGRLFHTLSGLGFFSEMARAREEARDIGGKVLRLGVAAMRALARTGRYALDVEIKGDRRRIDAYAMLVTCNHFTGSDWRRASLDAGLLEVHIAQDAGSLARLKAGVDLLTGGWRDNAEILSVTARSVRIASMRQRAFVATDGELHRERMPLVYEIRPRALTVLAP